jgi:radical SAM superfamily enzyme YgiQ (UPF0313 family)
MEKIIGKRAAYMPLSLPTVAALTPPEYRVEVCDENIESINFETDCEIVGISSWSMNSSRAYAIADKFRGYGKSVVIGGPHPTSVPEEALEHADAVFIGEAESTWPQFLADYQSGDYLASYKQAHPTDMVQSPIPRFNMLKLNEYLAHSLQTTRGCPFKCEFCDVPLRDGQRARSKSPIQVVSEVQQLQDAGARFIYICDDNFIGDKRAAKEILRSLAEHRRSTGSQVSFGTYLTINVATDDELLNLLHDANFGALFVGIESPRVSSLKETRKLQNTLRPIIDDIHKIQAYDLSVMAGIIVGFDHDDLGIFRDQYDFLTEASIPMATVSMLNAIPGTPLYERMKNKQRLISDTESGHHAKFSMKGANIIPKQMTSKQLEAGYCWLWKVLYRYDDYAERVIGDARWRGRVRAAKHISTRQKLEVIFFLLRSVSEFICSWDAKKRNFFFKVLRGVLTQKTSWKGLQEAVFAVWYHRFLREALRRAEGYTNHEDPERAPDSPPVGDEHIHSPSFDLNTSSQARV